MLSEWQAKKMAPVQQNWSHHSLALGGSWDVHKHAPLRNEFPDHKSWRALKRVSLLDSLPALTSSGVPRRFRKSQRLFPERLIGSGGLGNRERHLS